jgi:uncharacterized LabA/DUF88 family protein
VNRTYVYIDGFNLYNRALKNTRYKWLDINALCSRLLLSPDFEICLIRYFTAKIIPSEADPEQSIRQEIYLRALRTLTNVKIHFGTFLLKSASRVLAEMPFKEDGSWNTVRVQLPEEKGSDVNLASHLLCDGFSGLFDIAVLITSDSDFIEPIKMVRDRLGKRVVVFSPSGKCQRLRDLLKEDVKTSWRKAIRDSQFPSQLRDSKGLFSKPKDWK